MQHDDHSPDAGDSPVAPPGERRQDEAAAFDASGMLSTGRWMWEWIKVLSVTIVFILGVRAFVVEAFKIPTGSMENTLLVGDFLLVNKAVYGAEIPIAGGPAAGIHRADPGRRRGLLPTARSRQELRQADRGHAR
jgi:hypothetical protein